MHDLTDIRDLILSRRTSASEVVRASLARADAVDPTLGIMLDRFDEAALAAAAATDRALASGDAVGPLAGVPVGVKAILACREAVATAQSLVYDPELFRGRDAVTVGALREAGATVLGHTTMVEHAMGRPDPVRPFPVPRNPWDPERWPGGSSSGTGIGVAAQVFPAGLGTDTAGSVRIPASMCGITGLKTTHGLLSVGGCLPAAPTLDIVGPMARSSRDLRLMMEVLSPGFGTQAQPLAHRIGVVRSLLDPERGVAPLVAERVGDALSVLESEGFTLEEVELPEFDELVRLTMTVMIHEVFLEHERTLRTRWNDYGRSFRRLAVMGALVSADVYQGALLRAAELRAALTERFAAFDAVAMPTWPTGALSYFANGGTPADQTNVTAAWNAVGFPAISLPAGLAEEGMPVGLQLVGIPGADATLVALGECLQRATRWHLATPPEAALHTVAPAIPDPDAGVDGAVGDAGPAVQALRAQGFPLDDVDAVVVAQTSRMLVG
ncbi:amidase [Microbacterium sp. KR10-403]|uniref:amidase n=1 Tax=Microbacterium sp. KR10-403 TaxID=3158581 RepID=UPI0032E4E35D